MIKYDWFAFDFVIILCFKNTYIFVQNKFGRFIKHVPDMFVDMSTLIFGNRRQFLGECLFCLQL